MHFIMNVFVAPGETLDDAMAPFEECLESEDIKAWDYGDGRWDWWVEGGRWDGYWGANGNKVTAGAIADGAFEAKFDAPYGFLTLPRVPDHKPNPNVSRSWFEKEIYVSSGFWNEKKSWNKSETFWGLDYFIDAPHYEKHYQDYVASVPADTEVYAVDIHR